MAHPVLHDADIVSCVFEALDDDDDVDMWINEMIAAAQACRGWCQVARDQVLRRLARLKKRAEDGSEDLSTFWGLSKWAPFIVRSWQLVDPSRCKGSNETEGFRGMHWFEGFMHKMNTTVHENRLWGICNHYDAGHDKGEGFLPTGSVVFQSSVAWLVSLMTGGDDTGVSISYKTGVHRHNKTTVLEWFEMMAVFALDRERARRKLPKWVPSASCTSEMLMVTGRDAELALRNVTSSGISGSETVRKLDADNPALVSLRARDPMKYATIMALHNRLNYVKRPLNYLLYRKQMKERIGTDAFFEFLQAWGAPSWADEEDPDYADGPSSPR